MERSELTPDHPILTSANEVREICQPLFNYFNTTYFNFVRRYTDGSETCLTTNPQWTEYFYANKLYQKVKADKLALNKSIIHRIKVIPWSHFQDSPVRKAQSDLFETGIGITIIFTRDNYADFFHFATHNKNIEMQDLYQSYADCLIQFSHYFYDKGKDLIDTVTKKSNRLYLRDRTLYKNEKSFPVLQDFDIKAFLKSCESKRFYIYNTKMGDVFLTNIEMVCIRLLTEGKSTKEIGEKLHRSSRTVETHIQNVRDKIGLGKGTSRGDLIAEIYRSGFDLHELLLKPTYE